MKKLSTDLFDYNKKTNSFVEEISTLYFTTPISSEKGFEYSIDAHQTFKIGDKIELTNPKTNNSKIFECYTIDKDPSGEDIYGWRFKTDCGIGLLIIND